MSALEQTWDDGDLTVDLFAGGGGASTGMEAATGRPVSIAINHNPIALAVHKANHPRTKHFVTDVWEVDPIKATKGRRVRALWASADCRHFSRAKGGKPVSKRVRSLAWVIVKWAKHAKPDVLFGENVPEFLEWGPLDAEGNPIPGRKGEYFRRWRRSLEQLGYVFEHRILDASHYGAPTTRTRFFFVARRDGQPIQWPARTHGGLGLKPFHTAAECIDWSIPVPSIFLSRKEARAQGLDVVRPLAKNTLQRIAYGIRRFVIETDSPFIAPVGGELAVPTLIQTGYGERKGQAPRVLDLQKPLGTIVATGNKHALVAAFLTKHYGGVVGSSLTKPIGTVTAVDHHSLTTATLSQASTREPRPSQVRAFLSVFYGSEKGGQSLHDPLRTITTRDRFGLVTVHGVDYEISDIGMRMLDPRTELLRAQFGRFAEGYDLSAAKTKKDANLLVGNSVCPEVAEALVAANLKPREQMRRAA